MSNQQQTQGQNRQQDQGGGRQQGQEQQQPRRGTQGMDEEE